MVFKGVKRRYYLRLPAAFNKDRALPKVLVLHGGGGSGYNIDALMTGYFVGRPEFPAVVSAQDDTKLPNAAPSPAGLMTA